MASLAHFKNILARNLSRVCPRSFRASGLGGELSAALGIRSVSNRPDSVEIEIFDVVGLAVGSSCCIFCNNCRIPAKAGIQTRRQEPLDSGFHRF